MTDTDEQEQQQEQQIPPHIQINGLEALMSSPVKPLAAVSLNQGKHPTKHQHQHHQSVVSPYSKISNYSHEATTVPPYALYGIANSERQQEIAGKVFYNAQIDENAEVGDEPAVKIVRDPFIDAVGGSWGTLLHTVDNTPAYAEGVLYRSPDAFKELPDLEGNWGGDERLKRAMNNEGPNPYEKYSGSNSTDSSATDIEQPPKRRSKAKYWMATEKRETWGPWFRRVFLFGNHIPLFFRLFTIVFSVIALALSVRIFKLSKKKVQLVASSDNDVSEVSQQPSTLMAICVQSIGLVYLLYITRDEWNSKPLGIREPLEKMRLILLDLLFIILSSANLALSFNSLYDSRWVCSIDDYSIYPKIESICECQRALCAFLFVILVTWVVAFSISILRVVLKVSSNNNGR